MTRDYWCETCNTTFEESETHTHDKGYYDALSGKPTVWVPCIVSMCPVCGNELEDYEGQDEAFVEEQEVDTFES